MLFEKMVSVNDLLDEDLEPLFLVLLIVIVVLSVVGLVANRAIKRANDGKPVQTRPAKILSKTLSPHETHYYTVFEFNNGERLNLAIPVAVAGVFVVGDAGTLTYQGSKYLSFHRTEVQQ